ncbi:hypothetical protein NP554_18635 [Pseudomonas asiatica]|uniref:Uncharacterized protein n=1 Tax=Pseudomonas asiatica TaxID=2219225 RepID=A0A9X4HYJ4_9PSED|nr:hypothetical protein [Pseudomonas asiatica]MDD2113795.1 hypothetical protein [Pseudomonas asiatica]
MKAVVAGVIALAIAGGGWLGWNKYESSKETEAAAKAVQVSATQAERQMSARTEDGITFAEYFKRSGATIESLDKEIAALETRSWKHKLPERDTAITFIEQCKAIIRSDQADTRLLMKKDSAQEAYDDAQRDLKEADSTHAIDWALKRYQRKSDELLEVLSEQIRHTEESVGKVEKMIAADAAVKAVFGASTGLTQASVNKLKNYIEPEKADDLKENEKTTGPGKPGAS